MLRRSLWRGYSALTFTERRALFEGGTVPRMAMLIRTLKDASPEVWAGWKRYTDHSDQDFEEMLRAEYPISTYVIRLSSALFGIKVDFLLLGSAPQVSEIGTNIDVWPMTGSR